MKHKINLTSKKSLTAITLISIFLLFQKQIIDWYDNNIVITYLSQIKGSGWISFILLLIFIFIFYFFYEYRKKKIQVRIELFFVSSLLLLTYLFYRFFTDHYEYESFKIAGFIKYSDFTILLFGGIILLKVYSLKNLPQPPIYNSNPFLTDLPINNSSTDIFKRKDFARQLAIKIQSKLKDNNAGSFAIGINGVWGSGKTSFINMIREHINETNRIIIDFNPWRSSSASKIIEDFFELIISELGKYDSNLLNNLSNYAKTLTKIDENIISKSVSALSDYLFDTSNKNETYKNINGSIGKIKKQIFIVIDDLDRLDKPEIIEVLRLIRNTANFNNVVYIACYDKQYLLEAIKEFNAYNYEYFLEKIFQFEFVLPTYDLAILRNSAKELLKENLGRNFSSLIDTAVDYRSVSGRNFTNSFLKTQRDVVRFCNLIFFDIELIKNEVNFIDFYLVELLKIKFPKIYFSISNNKQYFFVRDGKKIRLRNVEEKNTDEEFVDLAQQIFESEKAQENSLPKQNLFDEFISRNNLSQLESDFLNDLMNELLKEKKTKLDSVSLDPKCFVNYQNFEKYFNIRLLESDIPFSELESLATQNYETYKEKIFGWIAKGRLSDIQDMLEKTLDFSEKIEWENHLKILIDIARIQFEQNGPYGIDYRRIVDVFNYPAKNSKKEFFKTSKELHNYVRNYFKNVPFPYVFEGHILVAALTGVRDFPLKPEEIESITLEYLKKYCLEAKSVTSELYSLYRNCITKDTVLNSNPEISLEANEIFKNFFKTYEQACQLGSFIRQVNPDSKYYQLLKDEWSVFFEKIDHFIDWIKTSPNLQDSLDCRNEMLDFIEKSISNDFGGIIFNFKHLTPIRWQTRGSINLDTNNNQSTLADVFDDE